MNYTDLSKTVSYALRHAPQKFGLNLDEHGWVGIDELICALKSGGRYRGLTEEVISEMAQSFEKKRFEVEDGRIRALYGHSIEGKIAMDPLMPPKTLYHGTARRFLKSILRDGLTPQKRQYVHLSEDIMTAENVGKRRDSSPAILKIDALRAWEGGISFYYGGEKIWMSDKIPPMYLAIDEG